MVQAVGTARGFRADEWFGEAAAEVALEESVSSATVVRLTWFLAPVVPTPG